MISGHVNTVRVSFLVHRSFTSADARDTITAVLGPSEEVDEQEPGDGEQDIENLWDVSELRRSSKRFSSSQEPVKSFCELLSLPVPTTVVES